MRCLNGSFRNCPCQMLLAKHSKVCLICPARRNTSWPGKMVCKVVKLPYAMLFPSKCLISATVLLVTGYRALQNPRKLELHRPILLLRRGESHALARELWPVDLGRAWVSSWLAKGLKVKTSRGRPWSSVRIERDCIEGRQQRCQQREGRERGARTTVEGGWWRARLEFVAYFGVSECSKWRVFGTFVIPSSIWKSKRSEK